MKSAGELKREAAELLKSLEGKGEFIFVDDDKNTFRYI